MNPECRVIIKRSDLISDKTYFKECKVILDSPIESNIVIHQITKKVFSNKTNMIRSSCKTRSGRVASSYVKSTCNEDLEKPTGTNVEHLGKENMCSTDNRVLPVSSNIKEKSSTVKSTTVKVGNKRNLRNKPNLKLNQVMNAKANNNSTKNVSNNIKSTLNTLESTMVAIANRRSVSKHQISKSHHSENDSKNSDGVVILDVSKSVAESSTPHTKADAKNKRIVNRNQGKNNVKYPLRKAVSKNNLMGKTALRKSSPITKSLNIKPKKAENIKQIKPITKSVGKKNKILRKRKTCNYAELSLNNSENTTTNVPIYKKSVPVLRDHKPNDVFEFDFAEERKLMKLNKSLILEQEISKAVKRGRKKHANQQVNEAFILADTNMLKNKFVTKSGRHTTVLVAPEEKKTKANNMSKSPIKEQNLQNVNTKDSQQQLNQPTVHELTPVVIGSIDELTNKELQITNNESHNFNASLAPSQLNDLYSDDSDSDADNVEFFYEPEQSANKISKEARIRCDANSSKSSPWRPHLMTRNGSNYLITNKSNLPVYNQKMVIDATFTTANTSMNTTINIPPKTPVHLNQKQTSLLDYFESSHIPDDKENSTLFDMNLLSPIKKSTPLCRSMGLNKRSPLKCLSHNIFNISSNHENTRKIDLNRSPLKSIQVLSNTIISKSQDENDMYFGFDKSIEVKENAYKPSRFCLKEKKNNNVLVPCEDQPVILEQSEVTNQHTTVIQEDQSAVDNKFIGIYDDMDDTMKIPDITYTSKIRGKRKYVCPESGSEDEDKEEDRKKKKKRKHARTHAENREYREWASKFNEMCEQVDQHVLHVE